jgi:hypothetical protein
MVILTADMKWSYHRIFSSYILEHTKIYDQNQFNHGNFTMYLTPVVCSLCLIKGTKIDKKKWKIINKDSTFHKVCQ